MNTKSSNSKNNLSQMMIIFGFIVLAFIAVECRAAVYVCDNEACSTWRAINAQQNAYQATTGDKTTVDGALQNTKEQIIQNGYGSIAGNNLYISKFWHKGGDLLWDSTYDHITVKVYKNVDEYKGTCHVYPIKIDGKNGASCNNKR